MDLFSKYREVVSLVGENTYFRKCGFVSCNNGPNTRGGILVTGINPSVPINGLYVPTPSYPNPFKKPENDYFRGLASFLPAPLLDRSAYLDLFPFYEMSQETLLWNIRQNPLFAAKVLSITKEEIENLQPKLIIIASKASYPYWGSSDGCVWMGYAFKTINPFKLNYDLRQITGFRDVKGIIGKRSDSCLRGSVVVLYRHERGVRKENLLTPEVVERLYQFSISL